MGSSCVVINLSYLLSVKQVS